MRARMTGDVGGIALVVLSAALVLLAAGSLLLSVVTDLGVAAARARTAADAAALAAAGAARFEGAGPDPCHAAREVAEANGAVLRACDADKHQPVNGALYPAVEVEVEVRPSSSLIWPVPARAAAALRPLPS